MAPHGMRYPFKRFHEGSHNFAQLTQNNSHYVAPTQLTHKAQPKIFQLLSTHRRMAKERSI